MKRASRNSKVSSGCPMIKLSCYRGMRARLKSMRISLKRCKSYVPNWALLEKLTSDSRPTLPYLKTTRVMHTPSKNKWQGCNKSLVNTKLSLRWRNKSLKKIGLPWWMSRSASEVSKTKRPSIRTKLMRLTWNTTSLMKKCASKKLLLGTQL